MENIGASVSAVLTAEKKEDVGEEEYTEHENRMYFFLKERPEYRISAVDRWLETSKGKMV